MNVFSKPVDHSDSTVRRPPGDDHLAVVSQLQPGEACAEVGSFLEGLSQTEADARLKKFGLNLVTHERTATILQELWGRARNPLSRGGSIFRDMKDFSLSIPSLREASVSTRLPRAKNAAFDKSI
jgi:hypothetical protein